MYKVPYFYKNKDINLEPYWQTMCRVLLGNICKEAPYLQEGYSQGDVTYMCHEEIFSFDAQMRVFNDHLPFTPQHFIAE